MRNKKLKNTDDILNSIDGIHHTAAPDFFYTRLKARMEKETAVSMNRKRILQPLFIISGLVLLLLINAMVLFKDDGINNAVTSKNNDNMQTVITDYHINDVLAEELNQ